MTFNYVPFFKPDNCRPYVFGGLDRGPRKNYGMVRDLMVESLGALVLTPAIADELN